MGAAFFLLGTVFAFVVGVVSRDATAGSIIFASGVLAVGMERIITLLRQIRDEARRTVDTLNTNPR